MSDPVGVRVRDCECPGTPHAEEGDVVYLRPTLGLAGGLAAENDNSLAIAETLATIGRPPKGGWSPAQQAQMVPLLTEGLRSRWLVTYVRHGAMGWNLTDEDGPVPFDVQVILDDYNLAQPVAEKCDELYGETVARPLLARLSARSPSGRMGQSISRRTSTTRRRKPSSPATTAGSRRLSR